MKAQVIYKIRNLLDNKFYVGSTTNTRERFRTHRNKLRGNRHHCAHLQSAWNRYGEDIFKFEVIQIIPNEESLQVAEDKWLQEWVGKPECYNHGLRSGAPWRGCKPEQHPNYGKLHSDETKRLIKKARAAQSCPRTGTKHTEETKELIRQKKLENPSRAWLGKTRDEATRKKIGDTQRGVKKSPRVYTEEGLQKAQENMKRHAKEQKPSDFSDVLAKFPQEVIDKYDFTNAVYTGALNRITGCKCPKHGEFSQYAAQFRKGRGCPQCGNEERAESKRNQMKEFWSSEEGRSKFIDSRKQ